MATGAAEFSPFYSARQASGSRSGRDDRRQTGAARRVIMSRRTERQTTRALGSDYGRFVLTTLRDHRWSSERSVSCSRICAARINITYNPPGKFYKSPDKFPLPEGSTNYERGVRHGRLHLNAPRTPSALAVRHASPWELLSFPALRSSCQMLVKHRQQRLNKNCRMIKT